MRGRSRLAALFLAAATVAAPAHAQDSAAVPGSDCTGSAERKALAGVVIDSALKPLRDVTVYLVAERPDTSSSPSTGYSVATKSWQTVTDSLGRFCFTGLRAGVYRLSPRALGSWDRRVVDVLVQPSDTTHRVTVPFRRWALPPSDERRRHALLTQLSAQRAKWQRTRPARYRLRVHLQCFCFAALSGPPPTVEVAGDSVVAVHGVAGPRDSLLKTWGYQTVERIFDELDAELRNDTRTVKQISYDRWYGFPRRYESDTRLGITDMWYKVRVEFRAVRGR